jgi:hypothetical protein
MKKNTYNRVNSCELRFCLITGSGDQKQINETPERNKINQRGRN